MPKLQKISAFLDANVGRCPKCMMQSFGAAVLCGGLTAATAYAQGPIWLFVLSAIGAAGAALLWATHIVAFSLRSAWRARETLLAVDQPRRHFVLSFAKSAVFVATATAWPIGTAFAQTRCTCTGITPKCCYNYTGTAFVCAAQDAVCCAHATSPWSCRRGQNCTGERQCR